MFLLCLFYPICQLQFTLETFKFSGKLFIHTESVCLLLHVMGAVKCEEDLIVKFEEDSEKDEKNNECTNLNYEFEGCHWWTMDPLVKYLYTNDTI